jgi:hypothetical protein
MPRLSEGQASPQTPRRVASLGRCLLTLTKGSRAARRTPDRGGSGAPAEGAAARGPRQQCTGSLRRLCVGRLCFRFRRLIQPVDATHGSLHQQEECCK